MNNEFEVEYPLIVEQQYKFMISKGMEVTKQDVYNTMLQANIIDQYGHPTEWAKQQGYVKSIDLSKNPVAAFKAEYPAFSIIPDNEFVIDDDNTVTPTPQATLKVLENEASDLDNSSTRRAKLKKLIAVLKQDYLNH